MRYKTITMRIPIPIPTWPGKWVIIRWCIWLAMFVIARGLVYEVELWRFVVSAMVLSTGIAVMNYKDEEVKPPKEPPYAFHNQTIEEYKP